MCSPVVPQAGETMERWSDSTQSLVGGSGDPDEMSLSTPTSSRDATPPLLSSEPVGNGKSDTLRAVAQDDSLVSDLPGEGHGGVTSGGLYCDCPPDPLMDPELLTTTLRLATPPDTPSYLLS